MIESCPVKNYNSIKNTIIFERRERVFQRNFNDIDELRVVYLPIKFYRLNITYCNRFNITYRNRGVRLHDVKMSSRASFLFTTLIESIVKQTRLELCIIKREWVNLKFIFNIL